MVARASQKQEVDKMASTYDRLKQVWSLDTESAERFSKIQNCKEGITCFKENIDGQELMLTNDLEQSLC